MLTVPGHCTRTTEPAGRQLQVHTGHTAPPLKRCTIKPPYSCARSLSQHASCRYCEAASADKMPVPEDCQTWQTRDHANCPLFTFPLILMATTLCEWLSKHSAVAMRALHNRVSGRRFTSAEQRFDHMLNTMNQISTEGLPATPVWRYTIFRHDYCGASGQRSSRFVVSTIHVSCSVLAYVAHIDTVPSYGPDP
jgi:hypothetical protein